MDADRIDVGIFGGSGFYDFLDHAERRTVETPYGAPSAPVVLGEIDGVRVGFLPRHGPHHELPAHAVNYRANVWAMAHLGATDLILPCAAGSLRRDVEPGHLLVADQLVDRTKHRADTFFDGPVATHVPFADPYDAEMRSVALACAGELAIPAHDGGTVVVVNGPRFSTRAESAWFSDQGWSVVNMTAYPEAVLAREQQMAALNLSLVTDYDVGLDTGEGAVSYHAVMAVFQQNLANLRELLFALVPRLPRSPDRPALRALRDARGE